MAVWASLLTPLLKLQTYVGTATSCAFLCGGLFNDMMLIRLSLSTAYCLSLYTVLSSFPRHIDQWWTWNLQWGERSQRAR